MPILHGQFSHQGKTTDGKTFEVPAPIALVQRGPILQVTVGLAEQVSKEIATKGQPVPAPVTGLALIDTGASTTCVDNEVAKNLNLPVIDVIQMSSASHAAHPANVHPIRITITAMGVGIDAPRAVGAELKAQGLIALIGRDILQHCTLHYNGGVGEITLAI